MPAAFAGAIDLSALKKRATAPAAAPGPGRAAAPSAPAAPLPGAVSPFIVDVDEATFGSLLQASAQLLVVVHLWAEWAEPAKQLTPILEKLAIAAGGSWILAKVDVDANPRIAQAFGAQSLPMVVPVAAGQPVSDPLTAVLPEAQLRQWISALLDALRDHLPGIKQAEALAGPPGAGPTSRSRRTRGSWPPKRRWPTVTMRPPSWPTSRSWPSNRPTREAKAALAQTGLLARVEKLSPDVIARADAAPDDVALQRSAADLQLASGM